MSVDNFTNLDFDGLKQAFVEFLKDYPQFKDYNFTGSNISTLLDVLALNTYKNQFFLNMAMSEMFLDTAQLKDSVISHAKELNYLPRSMKSSVAYIDLQIEPGDNPVAIVVAKGTKFAARIDNSVYTFITDRAYTILQTEGAYTIENLAVYEGTYVTETFVVDTATDQRFVLSNPNIDIDSITVMVYPSVGNSLGDEFFYTSSFLGVNSTTKAYFLQPAEGGKYELFFGDDVIGKALQNLNYVEITYRVCAGSATNGATNFSCIQSIGGYSDINVTTVLAATGGAESEGVESIRYNAPRFFQSQDRAVNASDYETLLRIHFPEIQAISVFGGEDMNPPQYGRVIISVDLDDADGVPDIKKTAIEDFIRTRCAATIRPRVIDPEFLYVELVSTVEYATSKTTLSSADIATKINIALTTFANSYLNDFKIKLIGSKIAAAIDAADTAILGNVTNLRIISYLNPVLGDDIGNVTIDFQNALARDIYDASNPDLFTPAITSSNFTYSGQSCVIEDNGQGALDVVTRNGSTRTALVRAGTVDYDTGLVSMNGFTVTDFVGDALKVYARPSKQEIEVTKNVILSLDLSNVNLSVIPG